jgi:hypothetical protein
MHSRGSQTPGQPAKIPGTPEGFSYPVPMEPDRTGYLRILLPQSERVATSAVISVTKSASFFTPRSPFFA